MDYFEPFWEGFRPIAARVPFCLWGVGCCDRKRAPSALPLKLIEEIVRRGRLCVVRDELTRSRLSGCRLPPPVVCPTVVAVPAMGAQEKCLLHVDHYDNVGPGIYEQMVAMAVAEAERTGRSYRQTNNLISPGHEGALKKTLDSYASADLVLTSRLHGCIIALAMGRRVLVVSGDHKVESFMDAAGLSDWVCDLEDVNSLPARLEQLPAQTLPLDFIEEGRRQNRIVAQRVLALLPENVGQTSCLPVRAASCRPKHVVKVPREPSGWKPDPNSETGS